MDVQRLVKVHSSAERTGQWLLIYNSVDDSDLWIGGSGSSKTQYTPESEQGRINLATRDMKIAINSVSENIVEVPKGDHKSSEDARKFDQPKSDR